MLGRILEQGGILEIGSVGIVSRLIFPGNDFSVCENG